MTVDVQHLSSDCLKETIESDEFCSPYAMDSKGSLYMDSTNVTGPIFTAKLLTFFDNIRNFTEVKSYLISQVSFHFLLTEVLNVPKCVGTIIGVFFVNYITSMLLVQRMLFPVQSDEMITRIEKNENARYAGEYVKYVISTVLRLLCLAPVPISTQVELPQRRIRDFSAYAASKLFPYTDLSIFVIFYVIVGHCWLFTWRVNYRLEMVMLHSGFRGVQIRSNSTYIILLIYLALICFASFLFFAGSLILLLHVHLPFGLLLVFVTLRCWIRTSFVFFRLFNTMVAAKTISLRREVAENEDEQEDRRIGEFLVRSGQLVGVVTLAKKLHDILSSLTYLAHYIVAVYIGLSINKKLAGFVLVPDIVNAIDLVDHACRLSTLISFIELY